MNAVDVARVVQFVRAVHEVCLFRMEDDALTKPPSPEVLAWIENTYHNNVAVPDSIHQKMSRLPPPTVVQEAKGAILIPQDAATARARLSLLNQEAEELVGQLKGEITKFDGTGPQIASLERTVKSMVVVLRFILHEENVLRFCFFSNLNQRKAASPTLNVHKLVNFTQAVVTICYFQATFAN